MISAKAVKLEDLTAFTDTMYLIKIIMEDSTMRKFTRKEIRCYVSLGIAEDITGMHYTEAEELSTTENLEKIGCSVGTYGINAGLLQSRKTGKFYAVLSRNYTLLALF